MTSKRLALFDCDGTLADSQHMIVDTMQAAFEKCGHCAPDPVAIRTRIGLSLPHMVKAIVPSFSGPQLDEMVETYRETFFSARNAAGATPEPLYEGIVQALKTLSARGWLLGVATGKSQRGLLRLLDAHDLTGMFITLQTADFHPSKPDPSMVYAAMRDADVTPSSTIVIGDTGFDMAMACSAGAGALGVRWGYHSESELRADGARAVAQKPSDLPDLLDQLQATGNIEHRMTPP